ncbi:hypothetical protein E2C01_089207 [Portunus trituberculatus]|uniref:Uncharacterized protein n=1 Tax=Portunus trituberculatus TaxID=210409 RepID=A0A5B7JIG8_PORTR|nr:hypothetical protein [Portunus trituberculatus]
MNIPSSLMTVVLMSHASFPPSPHMIWQQLIHTHIHHESHLVKVHHSHHRLQYSNAITILHPKNQEEKRRRNIMTLKVSAWMLSKT